MIWVNRIGMHGFEVVTLNGCHFCIPMAAWNRMMEQMRNEAALKNLTRLKRR